MSKVAVVFWSGTGNTEAMAKLVVEGAQEAGAEVAVFEVSSFSADMVDAFDTFAFGCPAMGDEELEEDEFLPVYDEVEPLLAGKKVALFGSYDWNDGEWMRLWEERAREAGLDLVDAIIAKDYPDDEAEAECKRIGAALA